MSTQTHERVDQQDTLPEPDDGADQADETQPEPDSPEGDDEGDSPDAAPDVEGMEQPHPDKAVVFRSPSGRGALSIDPEQEKWTPAQVTGLKSIGIEVEGSNAVPHAYVWQFLHVCQSADLDPWRGEAHLITYGKRWTKDNGETVDSRKFALVVGIDGFRKRAADTGQYVGQIGPQWCGDDGVWKDFWSPRWGKPTAARVGILRDGFDAPVWGVAMYDEYVALVDEYEEDPNGGRRKRKTGRRVPNSVWEQRPAGQLAKCGEALGHRKAFPRTMAGIYEPAEMERAHAEYEQQEHDERRLEATRRRQRAYAEAQPQPPEITDGRVIEGRIVDDPPRADGPVRVGDAVPHAAQDAADAAPQAPTDEDRAAWLRDEIEVLSGLYGQPVSVLTRRQEEALGRNYDTFTASDLWRVVAPLRRGGVSALRRQVRHDEADMYESARNNNLVAPVHVLLGTAAAETSSTDVDPASPHTYVDNQGVCAVPGCDRFEDDVVHTGES